MHGREHIHVEWLIKLRWVAIAFQLVLLGLCVELLNLSVQWEGVAVVTGLAVASNAAAEYVRRRSGSTAWLPRAALTFDVLLFSALLWFTGGPLNPFSFLYVVYLALGAVVLDARWSWALAVLAFGLLGLLYVAAPRVEHVHQMQLHLAGMWVALGVAAVLIVYFVVRVSNALFERERQLAQTRRLASLATLATGAAHELSTPLSTIAVVARELEKQLGDSSSARADAALIRAEVERCRQILSHLQGGSGVARGEVFEPLAVRAWAEQAVTELGATNSVQVEAADGLSVRGPRRALVQALKNVVDNGLKAGSRVRVLAVQRDASVEVSVEDDGPGIREDLLAHIGEPFFTTREPGAGMGLGVFLARTVLEQAGGTLHIASAPASGTRVTLTVPGA